MDTHLTTTIHPGTGVHLAHGGTTTIGHTIPGHGAMDLHGHGAGDPVGLGVQYGDHRGVGVAITLSTVHRGHIVPEEMCVQPTVPGIHPLTETHAPATIAPGPHPAIVPATQETTQATVPDAAPPTAAVQAAVIAPATAITATTDTADRAPIQTAAKVHPVTATAAAPEAQAAWVEVIAEAVAAAVVEAVEAEAVINKKIQPDFTLLSSNKTNFNQSNQLNLII